MYEAHYGFEEKPFNLTPDPKYLFLSQRHTEAFAHLEFGHRERGGFVVITGDVGTGKTTLARYFLGRLGPTTDTAVVLYPAVTAAELLRSTLEDLKAPCAGDSLKDLVDALHRFLLEARERDRNVVLLIDEAQDLSAEVLEQVRLISNLETDTEKLIQIVLMGQPELHELLSRRDLRQLAQRVTARYHLGPLSRAETAEYVRHRLRVAGGAAVSTFGPPALDAVHRHSGGVPRLVNLLCDRALLAGYVAGTRQVDAGLVRKAAVELEAGVPRPTRRRLRLAAAGAGLVALAAASATLVPPPVPDAGASTTTPAPSPPAASGLDAVLLSLPESASLEAARAEVTALWGPGELEETPLLTHLDQLRRLDLPAVLEMFHPERRDLCHVALLGLAGDEAVLGTGSDVRLRVPVSEISRSWTRRARVLWRDRAHLSAAPTSAAARAWVSERLASLDYVEPGEALERSIARFQRDRDLEPDGLVGPRTLMALYGAAPAPGAPRLSEGSS